MHRGALHQCGGHEEFKEKSLDPNEFHVLPPVVNPRHTGISYIHKCPGFVLQIVHCCKRCRQIEMLWAFSWSSAALHYTFIHRMGIGCLHRDRILPCNDQNPLVKHTHTSVHVCTLTNASLHGATHAGPAHSHIAGMHNKGKKRVGPPANLMHGDHFQNRTKWWAISRWQSGSLQGPRGGMACNCVQLRWIKDADLDGNPPLVT